ncbi:response regulator transcription factor [Curtobacterium sp. NPDC090217]|uniref:response regulator transcription factor n=1 Tax=unclassified Curtobacterium TaxID=257496 RepID=UPI0007D736A3|nr:response regulator transcription factor [Curtobacterium sp. 9128]SBN64656.1 two component transcriptional regulator, LuxR family [Curtobacterium sp. 9128]
MTLRVLVVDDQAIARAGLATMLDAEDDIDVVGQAHDGESAVRAALATEPDVIVMDIRMPGLDGIGATRRILAAQACAVVLITTFDDDQYLFDGIAAGASGFLLKDSGPDLIGAAVRAAARGDSLIDPAMTRALIDQSIAPAPARRADAVQQAALASLSDRERDVLSAVARGLSNGEIASEMFLSTATVKSHISSVFAKTGTKTRVQAVVFAFATGFTDPSTGEPVPPSG